MVYLLSIGFTLLVMAFSMMFLMYTMRGGKEANLWYSGLFIFVFGAVAAIAAVVLWWLQCLSGQEREVFANTGIAISLTGLIAALQGKIQQDRSKRRVILWGAIVPLVFGVAFIICFLIAR